MRTGHVQAASDMMELCFNKYQTNNTESANKLETLLKWVQQFGEELNLQSVVDIKGKPIATDKRGLCNIVVFADADPATLKRGQLDPILKIGEEKTNASEITVTLIYIAPYAKDEIEPSQLTELQQTAEKHKDLEVWIVDSETNFNFFKKYPSAERPFVVLLDANKRISSIDPTPAEFKRQVSILTKNTN